MNCLSVYNYILTRVLLSTCGNGMFPHPTAWHAESELNPVLQSAFSWIIPCIQIESNRRPSLCTDYPSGADFNKSESVCGNVFIEFLHKPFSHWDKDTGGNARSKANSNTLQTEERCWLDIYWQFHTSNNNSLFLLSLPLSLSLSLSFFSLGVGGH